jgi:hypothetical protein
MKSRKRKRKDGRDVQRRGVGSLRFAGIDWEKQAERRRGRKTRGYNSTELSLSLSSAPSAGRANLQVTA